MDAKEIVEACTSFMNGNISDFRKTCVSASKLDILNLIVGMMAVDGYTSKEALNKMQKIINQFELGEVMTVSDIESASFDLDNEKEEEEEEEEEGNEDAVEQCYYQDPSFCKGEIWQCQTCEQDFCEAHFHNTEKGDNVECVACESERLEEELNPS